MSSLKEKIAEAISKHISLEDTYTYELTRVKDAFEIGTVSLEDFEEWSEENVDDLAKTIVDALQPQLNENQKLALEVLKIEYEDRGNCAAAIYWALEDDSLPKLEKKEFAQVLQAFSQWVLEQEEHNERS